MDEGRLGLVRRRENSQRKYVCILNEMAKSRWEITDDGLSRDKYETGIRYDRSVVSLRRTVVKQRILQECMKMRREDLKDSEKWLGRYGGKNVHAFGRDIDRYLTEMHPKRRRLKKIQKIKTDSVKNGKILSPSTLNCKMKEYFEKIVDKDKESSKVKMFLEVDDEVERKDIFKQSKNHLPPLRGFVNQYNRFQTMDATGVKHQNETDEKSNRKHTETNKIQNETETESETKSNSGGDDLKLERKPTIILPPIQTSKDMIQRKRS